MKRRDRKAFLAGGGSLPLARRLERRGTGVSNTSTSPRKLYDWSGIRTLAPGGKVPLVFGWSLEAETKVLNATLSNLAAAKNVEIQLAASSSWPVFAAKVAEAQREILKAVVDGVCRILIRQAIAQVLPQILKST